MSTIIIGSPVQSIGGATVLGLDGQPIASAARSTSPIDATAPHEGVSGKYQFISTRQLIDAAEAKGFEVRTSNSARSRKYAGFQKHVVRLAAPDALRVGQEFPELVVQNAHAGTASLQLYIGVYRLVCANGLVVGSTFDAIRIRHTGASVGARVDEALGQFIDRTVALRERIEALKGAVLTPEQVEEFVAQAALLRFGPDAKRMMDSATRSDTYSALGSVRRQEDTGLSAWNVLNSVQENVIRGARGIRAVSSPTRDIELNRGLWDLAEGYVTKAA